MYHSLCLEFQHTTYKQLALYLFLTYVILYASALVLDYLGFLFPESMNCGHWDLLMMTVLLIINQERWSMPRCFNRSGSLEALALELVCDT